MIVDGIRVETIPRFPNYAISKDGRVWSFPRVRKFVSPVTHLFGKKIKSLTGRFYKGKWLKPTVNRGEYQYVPLYKGERNEGHICWIHRLVLETYIGPRPSNTECRHLNNNPSDNRLGNLCWGTKKENQHDRIQNGTSMEGVKHPLAKLTEQQVRQIIYTCRTGLFTLKEIASWYNVEWTTIRNIKNRKSWKHLWMAM